MSSRCQWTARAGHSDGVWNRRNATSGARVEILERLFRDHARHVFAYAARRAPDRADDVVAETFAIAWRRLDRVPEDAEPWLYGVARRVLAGYWRSDARQLALISRLCELEAPADGEDEADHSRLYELLERLGESDREALLLTYWEGLEPARAAAALGISRDAFHQRVHRARERLRALSATQTTRAAP
jgi:RNA polymerase sigma-70 factor (ECF subfamily)